MASSIAWTPGDGVARDGKPHYCTYNDFTMARYSVNGVWRYGLHKGRALIGFYDSPTDATNDVRKLEA